MKSLKKYVAWMTTIWCVSLTGCATVVGDFCSVYQVVDMPGAQAALLDRQYQERILANEVYQLERCR